MAETGTHTHTHDPKEVKAIVNRPPDIWKQ